MRSLVLLSSYTLLALLFTALPTHGYKYRGDGAEDEAHERKMEETVAAAAEDNSAAGQSGENVEAQYGSLHVSDMQTLLEDRGLPKHQIPSDRQELVELLVQTDSVSRMPSEGIRAVTGDLMFEICTG